LTPSLALTEQPVLVQKSDRVPLAPDRLGELPALLEG